MSATARTRVNRRATRNQIILTAVLAVIVVLQILPLLWTVSASLKTEGHIFDYPINWLPSDPRWANYAEAWAQGMSEWYRTSVIEAIVVTASQVVFCAMAGYAFAKLQFPLRNVLFLAILSTLMIPIQLVMVPLYDTMAHLGWVNTYQGLIIPFLIGSFGIFLMRQFAYSLPDELLDAGRIDGCGEIELFWRIVLPNLKIGMGALGIFTFFGIWSEFFWGLLVSGQDVRPLTVGLALFTQRSDQSSVLTSVLAGSVIAIAPVLLVFLFFQRFIASGLMIGSIKG
jgi:multiple sugar transport system permease protein